MRPRKRRRNLEVVVRNGPELCDRCGVFGRVHVVRCFSDVLLEHDVFVCNVCLPEYVAQLRAMNLEYRVSAAPRPATSNDGR